MKYWPSLLHLNQPQTRTDSSRGALILLQRNYNFSIDLKLVDKIDYNKYIDKYEKIKK